MKGDEGSVLVVDDNEVNRDLLAGRLQRQDRAVSFAEDEFQALEMIRSGPFDWFLLDIMMSQMNGYQVLQHLKADQKLHDIPAIVISAVDDIDSIFRCIELGAEDDLPQPFDLVLRATRIGACLEKKRLRDRDQAHWQKLAEEQSKSERLLGKEKTNG